MAKKQEMSDEDCCYCFVCLMVIGFIIAAIILAFIYWYVSLPIVAGIIIMVVYYRKHQKEQMARLLDTVPHQHEYQANTGQAPIINGKLTDHYKDWLLLKANISTMDLFKPPQATHVPSQIIQGPPIEHAPTPQSISNVQPYSEDVSNKQGFCPLCGSKLKFGAKFCTACGNKVT